jgi:hypothetical protein
MLDWEEELRRIDHSQGLLHQFRTSSLTKIYLNELDETVAMGTNYELAQYYRKSSKVFLPQFSVLEKYGK